MVSSRQSGTTPSPWKRGAITQAYVPPAPGVRVICADQMGPIAVKTYPGEEWKAGTKRATAPPTVT